MKLTKQRNDNKLIPRTRSRVLIVLSGIVTVILHPLFITTFTGLIIYELVPGSFKNFPIDEWMVKLFLFTIILPFLSIFLLKISGLISNARMHKPRDRYLPLLASMIFYFVVYHVLNNDDSMPLLMQILLMGSFIAILFDFLINFFYKVSVHTTGVAILPGMCAVLMLNGNVVIFFPLLYSLLAAAILGLARWLLGAHTKGQILLGYAVGMISQVVAFLFLNT